jgi:hypothetical protein
VYVLTVSLVEDWRDVEKWLPAGWGEARLELAVAEESNYDRSAALLGPAQPYRQAPGTLRFSVARNGVEPLRRLLARLDDGQIGGTLRLVSSEEAPVSAPVAEMTLAESWAAALETLPADWSDLYGEIELISSDYLGVAAVQLAPINPRQTQTGSVFRFRCAATFGYGASPGMVARCLERCDAKAVRGTVRILRALSDTQPVGTQGPVWQIDGRTV